MESSLVNFSRKYLKKTMNHSQKRIVFWYFKTGAGKRDVLEQDYLLLEVLYENTQEKLKCISFIVDLLSYEEFKNIQPEKIRKMYS